MILSFDEIKEGQQSWLDKLRRIIPLNINALNQKNIEKLKFIF